MFDVEAGADYVSASRLLQKNTLNPLLSSGVSG
jgi:hypothetical protein